jgi:hypothetical protein
LGDNFIFLAVNLLSSEKFRHFPPFTNLSTKGEQPFVNLVRRQFELQPPSTSFHKAAPNIGRKVKQGISFFGLERGGRDIIDELSQPVGKLFRRRGPLLLQPPAERTTSSRGNSGELQVERQCIGIRCRFGERLMEVRKDTLLRLLAKALAQKGVRLRTQHHAVKVGELLNLLE